MIKQTLSQKVPQDIQQMPEFKILLAIIKKEKLISADELKVHIDAQIKQHRNEINKYQKTNPSGTMRRVLADSTKKLDYYELIKKKVLKYL